MRRHRSRSLARRLYLRAVGLSGSFPASAHRNVRRFVREQRARQRHERREIRRARIAARLAA